MCGQLGNAHFEEIVEAALAAGCQLMSIPRTVETAGVHLSLVWRQGQPVMQLSAPSLHGQQLLLKRVVDLLGASLLLIVTAPVMLLVAVAIKLDSHGAVLFGQERIGAGGRPFRVLKFPTMYNGGSAPAQPGVRPPMLPGEEDPPAPLPPPAEPLFYLHHHHP